MKGVHEVQTVGEVRKRQPSALGRTITFPIDKVADTSTARFGIENRGDFEFDFGFVFHNDSGWRGNYWLKRIWDARFQQRDVEDWMTVH